MKSLNELVTVNRKYAFRIHCIKSKYVRRKRYVMICESGNLPECWYRKKNSRSRGIDRTVYMSADSSGHLFLMHKHFGI